MKTYRHLEFVAVTARFSDCGRYRYLLAIEDQRINTGKTLVAIMQNPSVANEKWADRSVQFLERLFFKNGEPAIGPIKRLLIVNQFAYIQTKGFTGSNDRFDPVNESFLLEAITTSDLVLVSWGKTNPYLHRKIAIHYMLRSRDTETLFQTRVHPSRGYYDDFVTAYRPEEHLGRQQACEDEQPAVGSGKQLRENSPLPARQGAGHVKPNGLQ